MLFADALTSPPVAQATRSPKLTDVDPTRNAAAVTAARTATETTMASGAAFSRLNGVTGQPSAYAYSASNSTW